MPHNVGRDLISSHASWLWWAVETNIKRIPRIVEYTGTPQGSLSPTCAGVRPAKMQELPCIGSNPKCKAACTVCVSPATSCWLGLLSSFLTDWCWLLWALLCKNRVPENWLELSCNWIRRVLWNANSWLILLPEFHFCSSLANSQGLL